MQESHFDRRRSNVPGDFKAARMNMAGTHGQNGDFVQNGP
jgi:hypothetical protein